MRSMTGFGKADLKNKSLKVAVEVNSVNSRFLEYSIRMPKQLYFIEPKIKELIAKYLNRGKINMSVNYTDYGIGLDKLVINEPLADGLYKQLVNLKKKYKLSGEVDINHFLNFTDVFKTEKSEDIEALIWPLLSQAIEKALAAMVRMRTREGTNLKKDLSARLKLLSKRILEVEKLAPLNIKLSREKLAKKIEVVMSDGMVNGRRLEEEIAYISEKSDITEECVRFKSHIKQFTQAIQKSEAIGKRLNFILQEFNREVNTIGSKAGGTKISPIVLVLKEEIEKMREQVQNIE